MKWYVCITAALMTGIPAYAAEIKTEVKVATPTINAGQGAGPVEAGVPASFENGELFYHAMPSTPAPGTAVKVIDTTDDTDYINKVFELKTPGISAEVASYLRTTLDKESGLVDVSVNPDTGQEYLLVTAPIFQFPGLEAAIRALDHRGTKFYEDGTKLGTYKLKNRQASDIADLMSEILISKDGSVYADNTVNKIYYFDSPSYYDGALTYVNEFDVPPEMVRIECQIIEIEMDDDFNFGLALEAWKEGLPENVDMTLDWSQEKGDPGDGPAGWARYIAQNVQMSGMRPKAVANMINYLLRTGKAKVLSRPTVVAVNGQEATIASLDNINYKAYSTPDEPLEKQAQVGVSLTIQPTIGDETLTLDINASVNSVVGWSSGGTPIVNTRSTTANAVLEDGELFTLSGLRKDVITKSDERVPVLGAIPLVGYAFRHEIDVKKTSEIVVLLTPTKVTPKTGIMERERELFESMQAEINEPPPPALEQFYDKVILNKKY